MERQGLYSDPMRNVTEMGKAGKESAASICLAMLEDTADRAGKVAGIVQERTNSVTRQEPETVQESKNPTVPVAYPPLFERISEVTKNINRSLSVIEDIIRRLEL